MRSSACRRAMVWILCCLVANCLLVTRAARAQEFGQATDDVLAMPSGSGGSGRGSAVDPLSGSAISSALPALSGSLKLSDQFTLSNIRGSAAFAGVNPSGDKSCLTIRAHMRPDFANKALQQNWITAKNDCGRFIKINICYHGTGSCKSIPIPPWQTESAIIGYAPTGSEVYYQISLQN